MAGKVVGAVNIQSPLSAPSTAPFDVNKVVNEERSGQHHIKACLSSNVRIPDAQKILQSKSPLCRTDARHCMPFCSVDTLLRSAIQQFTVRTSLDNGTVLDNRNSVSEAARRPAV